MDGILIPSEIRPLKLVLIREDIILDQILRHWTQQEQNDSIKRLLNDEVTLRVDHLKVLVKPIPEEVVDDVEVVLVISSIVGVIARRRGCFDHF